MKNKKSSDPEILQAKEDIKLIQQQITKKRAILSRLQKQKSEKANQKTQKADITINTINDIDIKGIGEENIQQLYKQKEINKFLESQLQELIINSEDLNRLIKNTAIGKEKTEPDNSFYQNITDQLKNYQIKTDELKQKIKNISIQIKIKRRILSKLQNELLQQQNRFETELDEGNENSQHDVVEIGKLSDNIRQTEQNIEKLKGSTYFPKIETTLYQKSDNEQIEQLVYQLQQSIRNIQNEKEKTYLKSNEILNRCERLQNHLLYLRRIKSLPSKKDPEYPISKLISILEEKQSVKCKSMEIAKNTLKATKMENAKLIKIIRETKNHYEISSGRTQHEIAHLRYAISNQRKKSFEFENEIVDKIRSIIDKRRNKDKSK